MTDQDNTNDTRTPHEKKTGRVIPKAASLDSFTVRQSLTSMEAVKAYDKYLKDHKRRLRQLERLAAGELTPSSESYT
jgi:hypothetical protein